MNDQPSRESIDLFEGDDEASGEETPSVRGRRESPTRIGTNPWDDRTLPMLAGGQSATGRERARAARPVRVGTGSWDELLPPAVKHRHDAHAIAVAATRSTSPVRGGTHSWDELLAAMRAAPGVIEGAQVELTDVLFGPESDDPTGELREWLTPDDKKR